MKGLVPTMTADPLARAWEDAQRLLDDRGPWTTDDGAYLESEHVTVLVHPVHDDDPALGGSVAVVDVIVTVRPRLGRGLPLGAGVNLRSDGGTAVSRPLSARGQALFRQLPAGEWRARLVTGNPSRSVPPADPGPLLRDLQVIPRLLAAAAGDRPPRLREVYASADGRLTTEVVESPEARLVVRVSAVGATGRVALVRLRWAVELAGATEDVTTLVVPLTSVGGSDALVAKYDLGPLDGVHALRIGPAEWADLSELTGELVRRAFDYSLYGTARRAWEDLAASGECPAAARAVLHEVLAAGPL